MFTALQSAHLERANNLVAARDALGKSVCLICNSRADRDLLFTAMASIDKLMAVSIPNNPPAVEERT